MSGLIERFWRLLPAVRRLERSRALFFTGLLLLVSAAQTVGLAGSEALFLSELSARALPFAFVIASLLTVFGSMLYAARVGGARNDTIFAQMLVGAGAALALVPLLAPAPDRTLLYGLIAAFYLTQAIFTNHFWTFSGDYFDTLTSKRLFPVFTVGASLGGLLGGLAGAWVARAAGPVATIGVWGALLCAAAVMLFAARRSLRRWGPLELEEADETSVEGMRGAISYLRGSRLGLWLVLSALGMVLALFTAQYIYLELFVRAHPEPGDLAFFIAIYLAVTNLVEIALELWLTPWLIRRFGVASSHTLHPVLTLASFAALFASPVLATALLARANRELVENAVAQPVRTLVFNALPQRFRGRIRAFLEGIVVYAGMSAAGGVLLLLDDPDLRQLALLGGTAALLYLAANLGARRAYLRTLVAGIRAGRIDLDDLDSEIGEWEAGRLADLCDELLRVEGERPSRSLLQLIPSLGQRGVSAPLLRGLGHALPEVRALCAEALSGHPEAHDALLVALEDPSPEVRIAALHAVAADPDGSANPALRLVNDPEPRVRAAAAKHSSDGTERLRTMLRGGNPRERLAALDVVGAETAAEVADCIADPDPAVRAAALERLADFAPRHAPLDAIERALAADEAPVRAAALGVAAQVFPDEQLPELARALADAAAEVREAAVGALARRGAPGVEAALPYLTEPAEPVAAAALAVVARGEHPRQRALLTAELRHRVGEAWAALVGATHLAERGELPERFLHAAVADLLVRHYRLCFRCLEQIENPRIVRRVQNALRYGGARARGDALEVLSNLGDREAARLLVLMHEGGALEDRVAALGAAVTLPADPEATRRQAAESGDRWLCAAAAAGGAAVRDTSPLDASTMERLLALKRVPLFENLGLDQLDAIQRLARDATYLPGELIVREGEPGGELYLLLEGQAEAWLDYEGAKHERLSTIQPGDVIGEMAVLDNEPRSASVVVTERARLLVLDGESLKALVLQMPEIAFDLLRVMSARVRASERRLLEK